MNTSNDSRDAKMREMLSAGNYPDIRVALRDFDPQLIKEKGEIAGTLTIAGKSRPFVAKLENWRESASDVSFDASANLSLVDFGLTAPSVFGLLRVADEVAVTAHVVVQSADALRATSAVSTAAPRISQRRAS